MNHPERLSAALSDRYQLERELGAGGMATVYLAHDVRHDRKVAIKVLKPELAAVLGAERFVQEIKTTAALSHPHILPLFDSGTADGFLFYVMPYIQGETIREKLNRETQFGVDEAVRIIREVADALDYAHRHGVIHRDIKPENILLHDGRPMVMDFGIALAVSAAAGGRMTETGLSLGTPHYMSPEQATAEKEITGRSDVYSLASVLYEMLAGQPPHIGGAAQQVIMKILTEPAPSVATLRKSVPPNVAAAVARALEKLPADRFDSARGFSEALANPAFVTSTTGAVAQHSASRVTVSRTLFYATTTVAIIASASAAWLATQRPDATRGGVLRATIDLPDSVELMTAGSASRIAVSPDGSVLVFAGSLAGNTGPLERRLYVRRRDQLIATPLPGTELATAPFFSPDGRRVGFITRGPSALKVVGLDGAPPVPLTDSAVSVLAHAWGPDDRIYSTGVVDRALFRRSIAGGAPERVTTLDSAKQEVTHSYPDPLPGGGGVIFTVVHRPDNTNALRDIAVVDLRTGRHRILVRGVLGRYVAPGYLAFVRSDGVLAAVPFDEDRLEVTGPAVPILNGVAVQGFGVVDLSLGADGTLAYVGGDNVDDEAEVAWVSRDGAARAVDAGWRDNITNIALSPDGKKVAVSIAGGSAHEDVWIKELGTGALSKVTLGPGRSRAPVWHPDGERLVYISEEQVPFRALARKADGTGTPAVLVSESRNVAEISISRAGNWVLYRTSSADPGRGDILARRMGDTVSIPLIATDTDERHPALSPDGRWLAYRSLETGTAEVYVRPFPKVDDRRWKISPNGGSDPVWAHSGRELFYFNAASQLVSQTIGAGSAFELLEQRVLFNLPADVRLNPSRPFYDVSPDDRQFLMILSPRSGGSKGQGSRFTIVDNWTAELRAKVSQRQ